MMRTVDALDVSAPPDLVFEVAADVERWPDILPHYRWVRLLDRSAEPATVEMAANRPFGPLNWPTWWRSEMRVYRARREVRYRHIGGITTGMDVLWRIEPRDAGSHIHLLHEWDGPPWPLIRRPAAEWVIGPVFVHGIASRTIRGVAREAERRHAG
jgi:ribosome-associated toxin RatA of RatAB toxin-antitoxin module